MPDSSPSKLLLFSCVTPGSAVNPGAGGHDGAPPGPPAAPGPQALAPISLEEQQQFLEGLAEFGDKLGEADPERRAQVLGQIGLMSADPDKTLQWNAAFAIVTCAGPSVGGLTEGEASRLVGNAVGIGDSDKAVESLLSIKAAWPESGPAFDDVLAGKDCPAWANNISEIVDLLNRTVAEQSEPAVGPPPKKTAAKKKKK